MKDRLIETTTRGWGSRLMGSMQGILIGIVLFGLAFVLLWRNEGRTDLSKIADDSIPISAATVDPAHEGRLVAARGTLTADAPLGDGQFLAPGPWIELERNVEMYAWVERTSSESETNLGGSETTTTEYTYEKAWVTRPASSGNFKIPAGHENPPLTIEEARLTVPAAQVGAYHVDPERASLPAMEELTLTPGMVLPGAGVKSTGQYLLLGSRSLQSPRVGDVRISYRALPSDIQVTAFGRAGGSSLLPYQRGDATLYGLYRADREGAIAAMHASYKTTGMIMRLVGFLMMWGGLTMILGPIPTVLDVLPILGRLSRTVLGALTFGIALLLSLVTIAISALAHSPIALLLILATLLGLGWLLDQRYRRRPEVVAEVA